MDHPLPFPSLLGVVAALSISLLNLASGAESHRVVVWSEGTAPKNVYPNDINTAIAEGLKASLKGWEVVVAGIGDADQGVPQELLDKTDVLLWWGHKKHGQVSDATVERVVKRVKEGGMGFLSLHSSHFAKPYKALMGTACSFKYYKADGAGLQVTVKDAKHPIAEGVKDFKLDHTERYGEPFQVPEPEAVPFDGIYILPDGKTEPSRQGLCWTIGKGKVFYFQPGHETYPHYNDENVRRIMNNAVLWAAPKR